MLKQVLEIYELLDDALINGQTVSEYLKSRGAEQIEVKTIQDITPYGNGIFHINSILEP